MSIGAIDLSYAVSDVYYSQRGGLFRADYNYILGELRKLQTSQRLPQSYQDNVYETRPSPNSIEILN